MQQIPLEGSPRQQLEAVARENWFGRDQPVGGQISRTAKKPIHRLEDDPGAPLSPTAGRFAKIRHEPVAAVDQRLRNLFRDPLDLLGREAVEKKIRHNEVKRIAWRIPFGHITANKPYPLQLGRSPARLLKHSLAGVQACDSRGRLPQEKL